MDNIEAATYFFKNYAIWETINKLYFDGVTIEHMRAMEEDDKHDAEDKLTIAHVYGEDVMTYFFKEIEVALNTQEKNLSDEQEQLLLAFNKAKFTNYIQHG